MFKKRKHFCIVCLDDIWRLCLNLEHFLCQLLFVYCVLKNPISLIFSLFGFRDHCFKVEAFTNPTPTPTAGVSICDRLGSVSTPQNGIHWCHYLKSRFNGILKSASFPNSQMDDLLVRIRAYVNDVIGRWFEKVRNSHTFENWTHIWEFEKGHRFENLKKKT